MTISLSKNHRTLKIKIGLFIVMIILVLSIVMYLLGVIEDSEKKYLWLKNDITETENKIEGLNKKSLEFSEGVNIWEALPDEDKALSGLRINDAKDMLDKLQVKYNLSAVKTSFSKPEEIAGDYKTDTVAMLSSVITMGFNALSDEYVYEFIADLTKSFPGYVQVKSFSISKPSVVNKEILKKISLGEDVSIVSVTMDLYWQDLKYKSHTTAPVAPAGGTENK